MHLIIKNKGEIPLHMLTHLGISTARSDSTKIGQFGSGAKHGILVALRAQIPITIYSGLTVITPKLEPLDTDPSILELVFYVNGERRTTSMTSGFGDIDWKADINLALREFFSNAIDQGETVESCYYVTDAPTPRAGITQIVIPHSDATRSFVASRHEWYINHPLDTAFVVKGDTRGLCYLKGVKIGQMNVPCLFHYNFSTCELNESRVVSSDVLCRKVCDTITRSKETLIHIFRNFNLDTFETQHISSSWISSWRDLDIIFSAWRTVFGDKHPITSIDHDFFDKKKIPYHIVPANWYRLLSESQLGLAYDRTKQQFEQRFTFGKPTPRMLAKLDEAWAIISHVDLTSGKSKPSCASFSEIMSEGKMTLGLMHNNTVCFNIDEEPSLITALEELTHYITGAADETRDFQDFSIRLAARLALRLETH